MEYGLGSSDRGGFDVGDRVGSHTEFVHSVARVARVVGLTEDVSMPAMKVVAWLWLYWPLALVRRVSFAMLERMCSCVVPPTVKHVSAMDWHVVEREKIR